MKVTVGIDAGISEPIAAISGDEVRLLDDLPVHTVATARGKPRNELDVHALHRMLVELGPIAHAFIERAASRVSNF